MTVASLIQGCNRTKIGLVKRSYSQRVQTSHPSFSVPMNAHFCQILYCVYSACEVSTLWRFPSFLLHNISHLHNQVNRPSFQIEIALP